jgi:hypothetical protein
MPSSSNNTFEFFSQDKKDVIKREIARLLDVSFIQEVYHPNWLAYPILVPKKNKELRECVDYTDLNCACKKDPFDLPRTIQVMESMTRCNLLSFLDGYLVLCILLYNNALQT